MTALKISVVIPTLNRPDDLRRCLAALKAQGRPADEVVVVIGPGDSTARSIFDQASKGDPKWRHLNEPHPSVISSLNYGIRETQGNIITLTDDDAAAPTSWLRSIETHFLRDPRVGAVGGRDRLMLPDEQWLANPQPVQNVGRFNWYGLLEGNHHCGAKVSPMEVDLLKGVNLSFRRDAFLKGQIDEYLIGYGAEVGWEMDICLTIKSEGWKLIYDNEVYVDHHVGTRIAGDDRMDLTNVNALRRVQNTAYLTAVYQRMIPMLMVLARSTLVGSRFQPGLFRGLVGLFTGRPEQLGVAFKVIGAYCKGTWDGRANGKNSASAAQRI
jgi:cellulose synthase/poly-beta-1,6-N-acetylglucosamine synthase-like glycosyltransferase